MGSLLDPGGAVWAISKSLIPITDNKPTTEIKIASK